MSSVITSNPDILGGTPVFRGTRVPVAMIFECLADGMTLSDILAGWPSLNAQDVKAAIRDAGKEIQSAA
jgi:uncharacterized protein (DUF433 family)